MLRSLNEIIGYRLDALDGELGKVKDLYFDDLGWVVRYLVVDTGKWLPGRKVLLAPAAVGEPRWQDRSVPVGLSMLEIEQGPDIREDIPVSRQMEIQLADIFNWEHWWATSMTTPTAMPTVPMHRPKVSERDKRPEPGGGEEHDWDPNLRSVKEVMGYSIHATDEELGQVEDFVCDLDTWMIRYLVVDTRKWLPSKSVLLALGWIDLFDWHKKAVRVGLSKEQVKHSPEYDPDAPVNRELETRLYDYYGRPKYWQETTGL